MKYISIGSPSAPTVVFAHGWGRTHHDFIQIAESIAPIANSILLDLPGFGETPRPAQAWSTVEYASHVKEFLVKQQLGPVIWVGHSFGGRIGLRLAVRHSESLSALVLVSSAGIPVQRSVVQKAKSLFQRQRFQFAKKRAKNQQEITALEKQYGSADYIHSAEIGLRDVFLKVIAEDQSADVGKISIPTRMIFGALDFETPVSIGQRLEQLIPQSQLVVCPQFNHFDILSRGRHQVALTIKELIQRAEP